jgi:dCMP deaminase
LSAQSARDKDRVFLEMAQKLGELGTCDRAHVGAIITLAGRAVSWGYNGAPPGLPHCDLNWHGWQSYALTTLEQRHPGFQHAPPEHYDHEETYVEFLELCDSLIRGEGCRNATHAEANAVAFAARQGISTEGGTLYVGVSPCANCARLLIAAGIKRVVWAITYRDPEGSLLLELAGIEKEVILPEGYLGQT